MFNVGDLVICNQHKYVYTNEYTLCIVAYVNEEDEKIGVFTLEGKGADSHASRIQWDNFNYFHDCGSYYVVGAKYFDKTSFTEWEDFKNTFPDETWWTRRNPNYDQILEYFEINKEEMQMEQTTVTAEPAITLKGTDYKFTKEQEEYVLPLFKKLLDEFKHVNTVSGIKTIWEKYKPQNTGLASLLSKHPNWDDKAMAIVLDSSFVRERDQAAVREFYYWCHSQLREWVKEREFKLACCTVHELKTSKSKLYSIQTKMLSLMELNHDWDAYYNHVTFNGMTYEEICEEYSRINDLVNAAEMRTKYIQDGMYVSFDVYDKWKKAYEFIDLLYEYTNHIADEKFAKKVNELAKPFDFEKNGKTITFGAVAGQKVSRIVNKFLKNYGFDKIKDEKIESWYDDSGNRHTRTKDYGWNTQYSKYTDAINPLEIKRKTIISINPIDYLTMSFGNGWASCHTIDKGDTRNAEGNYSGCYCSGTLSYMLDNCTVIMYTIKDGYKGTDYCLQDKVNRCNFHIGEDKFIQGRVYPDGREADCETSMAGQLRAIMQKVLAECAGENNLWTLKKGTTPCCRVAEEGVNSTNYKDWHHYSDCNLSLLKRTGVKPNTTKIVIGHAPICPCCGKEHYREQWLACDECREEYATYKTCPNCGEEFDINDSDAVFDEDTERWFCCAECAENSDVYYCENVNEWHSEWVFTDDYTGEYFHDSWADNHIHIEGEFHYLDEENANKDGRVEKDGEWHRRDDEDVMECPHCGEYTLASHEEWRACGAIIHDEELDEAV